MTLQNCNILLVDDDPNDIELAQLAFSRCSGAPSVYAVNNGNEALECLQGWAENSHTEGRQPRAIILDLKMSKVNGFEILTAIRQSPQATSVPVVILTSSRMPADIAEAYRLGCNAYVLKPVDHKEYTRAMMNLMVFWGELNLTPLD